MAFNRIQLADKLLQLNDEMSSLIDGFSKKSLSSQLSTEHSLKKKNDLLSLIDNIKECIVDIRGGHVLTQDEQQLPFIKEYFDAFYAFESAFKAVFEKTDVEIEQKDRNLSSSEVFIKPSASLLSLQQFFSMRLRKDNMTDPDISTDNQSLQIFFDPAKYAIFKNYVLKTTKGYQHYSDLGRIQNESKVEIGDNLSREYKSLYDVAILNDYMDISEEDESVFVLKLNRDHAKKKYGSGLFCYSGKQIVFQKNFLTSINNALAFQTPAVLEKEKIEVKSQKYKEVTIEELSTKKIKQKISPEFLIHLAKKITHESTRIVIKNHTIFTYEELAYMGSDAKQDTPEQKILREKIIQKFNPSLVQAINSTTSDGSAMDHLLRTYGTAVLIGNFSYSIIQPIVGGFLEGTTEQTVAGRPGRASGNKWSIWLFNTIMQNQVLEFKSFLSDFRNFQQLLQKVSSKNEDIPQTYVDLLLAINEIVIGSFRESIVNLTVNTKSICLLMQVALDIYQYKDNKNIYAQGLRLLSLYKSSDLIKFDSDEIDKLIENVKKFDDYIKLLQPVKSSQQISGYLGDNKQTQPPTVTKPKLSFIINQPTMENIEKKRWILATKLFLKRTLKITAWVTLIGLVTIAIIAIITGLIMGTSGAILPLFVAMLGVLGHGVAGSKIVVSLSAVFSSMLGFAYCKQEANEKIKQKIIPLAMPIKQENLEQPIPSGMTTTGLKSTFHQDFCKDADVVQSPVFSGPVWKSRTIESTKEVKCSYLPEALKIK